MKRNLQIVLFCCLLLGSQTTILALPATVLPEQQVELIPASKKDRLAKKAVAPSKDTPESLGGDYVMAILSATISLFMPWLVFSSAYVAGVLAILMLVAPLVLSLIVFGRHGRRKRAGGKTPFFVRLLAGIGLGLWAVWIVWALVQGGF